MFQKRIWQYGAIGEKRSFLNAEIAGSNPVGVICNYFFIRDLSFTLMFSDLAAGSLVFLRITVVQDNPIV